MRIIFLLTSLFWFTQLSAQDGALDFPALYSITGVAADDTLNLRDGPGTEFEIFDRLPPNTRDIEVAELTEDGPWALVNTSDWTGYVAYRFLQRQSDFTSYELPTPITCYGTEPFWDFSISPDGTVAYSDPETYGIEPDPVPFSLGWSGPAVARSGLELGAWLTGEYGEVNAVLIREICSDGMSDTLAGFSVRAIVHLRGDRFMLEGCCSIRP